ncbi:MAG: hypothetical protein JWN76_3510 [Chitinophagaceae bacterium]|nr:hypothetical protein [Chitinophagaceae bacterium]
MECFLYFAGIIMYIFLSYAELPAEGKLMLLDFYSNLHNVSKVTIQDWIEQNNPDIIMDNPTSPRLNDDDQETLLQHIHHKKG